MNKIVVIAGPTASGKSRIGVDLARKFNGEIISCDSMQVYKYMDIGTAKITQEEMQGIPHHMISVADPLKDYSVGEYAKAVEIAIKDVISRGKVPFIVGGSGLYIDSILYPLTFGSNKNNSIRLELQRELEENGAEYMHAKLAAIDPKDAEKIHPNNTKRVLRALEIYQVTGNCKSEMKEVVKPMKYDCLMIALDIDREELYCNINNRVDKMMQDGLLDEISKLNTMGIDFSKQSMQAIGYKEFENYFNGTISIDDTVEIIKKNTRNYAKRQITWLKRYKFAKWLSSKEVEEIVNSVSMFLNE